MKLNLFEKMLSKIFRRYTYRIYKKGVIDCFNYSTTINTTTHKDFYKKI